MAATAPPDVPVRSLQDILTALERHPEWRTALRQQLLGEELLELPAMFAKFASETTRRLDLLTTAITRLTNDVGELKGPTPKRTPAPRSRSSPTSSTSSTDGSCRKSSSGTWPETAAPTCRTTPSRASLVCERTER